MDILGNIIYAIFGIVCFLFIYFLVKTKKDRSAVLKMNICAVIAAVLACLKNIIK